MVAVVVLYTSNLNILLPHPPFTFHTSVFIRNFTLDPSPLDRTISNIQPHSTMNQELTRILWSPLPAPRFIEVRHTIGPSNSGHRLTPSQVTKWTDFEKSVLERLDFLGNPPKDFKPNNYEEFVILGNETGLQGRIVEHLGQSMGPIYKQLGLGISMADFQVGQSIDETMSERAGNPKKRKAVLKGGGGGRSKNSVIPDIVLLTDTELTYSAMGEFKTLWTFSPKENKTEAQLVTVKLGM